VVSNKVVCGVWCSKRHLQCRAECVLQGRNPTGHCDGHGLVEIPLKYLLGEHVVTAKAVALFEHLLRKKRELETARIITLAADRRRRPVLGRRYANADRRGDNDHMEDALWDLTPPRVPNGNNTQPSMRAFDILERTGNMANTRVGGTAGQGPSHTEQTEVDSAQGSTINQRTEAGTAVPNHERAHTTEERGGTGEFIGGNQVHVGLANVAQSRQRSYNPFAGAGHTTVAGTDWM
jgi:hypothetical protein